MFHVSVRLRDCSATLRMNADLTTLDYVLVISSFRVSFTALATVSMQTQMTYLPPAITIGRLRPRSGQSFANPRNMSGLSRNAMISHSPLASKSCVYDGAILGSIFRVTPTENTKLIPAVQTARAFSMPITAIQPTYYNVSRKQQQPPQRGRPEPRRWQQQP